MRPCLTQVKLEIFFIRGKEVSSIKKTKVADECILNSTEAKKAAILWGHLIKMCLQSRCVATLWVFVNAS